MSIQSVRTKIADVQSKIDSFKAVPKQKFNSILEEKLGVAAVSESTVASEEFQELQNVTSSASTLANGVYVGNNGVLYNCSQCAAESYGATAQSQHYYNGQDYSLQSLDSVQDYATDLPAEFAGAEPYMEYIKEASERYGMPVNLIVGIMKAESNFNNECVSSAGAKGLMQLMPVTAAEVGVTDEFDSRQNILGSVEYVTKLINRYDGDVRLALAAYNTGPGKIQRYGVTSSTSDEYFEKVPQSIRDYAERVLKYAGYVE